MVRRRHEAIPNFRVTHGISFSALQSMERMPCGRSKWLPVQLLIAKRVMNLNPYSPNPKPYSPNLIALTLNPNSPNPNSPKPVNLNPKP